MPATTVHPKIFWSINPDKSFGVTAANPNGDAVVIYHGSGVVNYADVQAFLNSLP